jgi:hypothetical protein
MTVRDPQVRKALLRKERIYLGQTEQDAFRIAVDRALASKATGHLVSNDSVRWRSRIPAVRVLQTTVSPLLLVTGTFVYETKVAEETAGLGLSVARKIVRDHDGFIEMECVVGQRSI